MPPPRRGDTTAADFEQGVKTELSRMLARAEATRRHQHFLEQSEGDEEQFAEADLSGIEPESKVPMGPSGIFPAQGCIWIAGPAGSGKTRVCYWDLAQYIKAKVHVAVYECEMGPARFKGAMLELGVTEDELDKFVHYFQAPEQSHIVDLVAHGKALDRKLERLGIRILLYDAVAPLLAAAGLNEDKAGEVRLFATKAARPVTQRGGLVYFIDHTGWSPGKPRGSSDKPAAGDVILLLEAMSRFRRGKSGRIAISCTKDRSGTIDDCRLEIAVEAGGDDSLRFQPDGGWSNITDDMRSVEGDARERSRQGKATTQDKIIYAIQEQGPLSVADLALATGLSQSAIRGAVSRGITAKALRRLSNQKIEVIIRP